MRTQPILVRDVKYWEGMAGDNDLEKQISSYLTLRFIGRFDLPSDECLTEAKDVIKMIKNHSGLTVPVTACPIELSSEIKFRTFNILDKYGFKVIGKVVAGYHKIISANGYEIRFRYALAFCSAKDKFDKNIGRDLVRAKLMNRQEEAANTVIVMAQKGSVTEFFKNSIIRISEKKSIYWLKGVTLDRIV